MRPVVDAIDAAHGTTLAVVLPVRLAPELGLESYFDGRKPAILINTEASHAELSLLHEVGHAIDHLAFAKGSWATEENEPLLREWRGAMLESRAVGELLRQRQAARGDELNLLRYYLQSKEIFARSYAQYVTKRSGSLVLLRQLRQEQRGLYGDIFWRDNDFQPLRAAFDRLLERKKWLTTKKSK